ncbi:hypothetical protein D2V93_00265 [Flagellimonas taeanensis]|jgi:hypothetical protein|uniref:hypothetical protein n=1 Tax=Flavobacteriaceae TaxID=49546 RepID=UPI000934C8F3|nr:MULTISPECIES: hypothetical protein [Allomuricauda]MDC6384305.1 hypothetical protein [Muricauda sp. SK9]MEE1962387.1 hypothetical protein [Allomuricauda taeanensis]RIV49660.1 hypothetical protein D2V93_12760 [Allomuricauda taeanensis]RIV53859.1 hypothetical protein D2V93_00265 [Allomuricauda taeanensis]
MEGEALASPFYFIGFVPILKSPGPKIGQTQKAAYSFSLVSALGTQQQHNPIARTAVDQMFNDPDH